MTAPLQLVVNRCKRFLAGTALSLALCIPSLVFAQESKPKPLLFEARSGDPTLSADYLHNLVEGALGVPLINPGDPKGRKVKGALVIEVRPREQQIIVTYRDATAAEFSEILLLRPDAQANSRAIVEAVTALEKAHRPPDDPVEEAPLSVPGKGLANENSAGDEEPKGHPTGYFPFNLSLFYPIALNVGRPNIITNADISILVSRIGQLRGLSLGTITYAAFDMEGAQVSIAALAGGHVHGLQFGGTFAYAGEGVEGAQISGVLGWADEPVRGLMFSGIASQSYKDLQGAQISGGASITRGQLRGVQFSGMLNIGKVSGLQWSSINVSAHVDGLQIGLINTARHVDGLQIGLINIARKIDGVQIGLLNVTENLSGESLGLANILKPGSIHPVVWGSSNLYGNAGFKFMSKYTYSILSGALHNENKETVGGLGLTLGVHLHMDSLLRGLQMGGDFGFYRLFRDSIGIGDRDEMLKTRLILAYTLVPRLTLFMGGGAFVGIKGADTVETRFGPEFLGGLEL